MKLLILFIGVIGCSMAMQQEQKQLITRERDSTYFATVFDDSVVSLYYAAFDIKSPNYTGRIIVHTRDLEQFFRQELEMTDSQYLEFMRELLLKGDTLKTQEEIANRTAFRKVISNQDVEYYAQQGQEAFLLHFFEQNTDGSNSGVIKEEIYSGFNKKDTMAYNARVSSLNNAIINQLFEWRIYAEKEDYTGNIGYDIDGPSERLRKVLRRKGTESPK